MTGEFAVAVHSLVFLNHMKETVSSEVLAKNVCTNPARVRKVLAKLKKKNIDMIVANNLKEKGAGFGTETNVVTFITEKEEAELPIMSKDEVADQLLDFILKQSRDKKDCKN